ncbi:MAG: PDZ domain-containing protein [Proteobacteria bacterium]|nr:PDZ domain-containing protein [Pseudomonadota bacterium]
MTDSSANETSHSGQRKPCIACREPIRPKARICPHCGSPQSGSRWKFLGTALKWIGAVTALISLVAGSFQLNGLLQSSRERSESVQKLVKAADMQIEYGDLDSALQLAEQALELQPGSREAGERQVTVAMMMLRRGFDYTREGYNKKIDSLLTVLYRGAVDSDPVRAADALAHIGLANKIRQFNQNKHFPVKEYFQRAVALDRDNVYAHVFWADSCLANGYRLDCGDNLQAAVKHYTMAMQDGRQQDYVRRQRFDQLRGSSVEGADILLIGDMITSWHKKIPLDEKQLAMIFREIPDFYDPDERSTKKLQELVHRFQPAEVLGMLEWAVKGQKDEQTENGPLLALLAYLTELTGNRPLAIARYRVARLPLRQIEFEGNLHYTPIRERVDWALAGLLEIRPAWLGVSYQEIDEELATSLGIPKAQGLFISDVTPGSPAATGGLSPGDVILEIKGSEAVNQQTLQQQMNSSVAGDVLALTILRKGKQKQLQLTLGEAKAPADPVSFGSMRGNTQLALLMDQLLYHPVEVAVGEHTLRLVALTDELRTGFKLERDATGVLVFAAQPGKYDSELRRGDLILAVNNHPVNSAAEVPTLTRQVRESSEPLLHVSRLRDGKRQTVAIKIN